MLDPLQYYLWVLCNGMKTRFRMVMIAHPGPGIGFHKRFMWRIIILPTMLRILFWSAFPTGDAAAAPVADEDHFGFPSLPSMRKHSDRGISSDEKLKKAEMGMDIKEAER